MHIAVIGAGASGILAALHAAWTGASVTLFEGNASVGRKLLVTGSGRCNITNANAAPAAYTCADPAWLDTLFARFGVADLIEVLHKVGIPVRPTFDGWYYPLSESAHTVVNAFHTALTLANVEMLLGTPVKSFTAGKHGFRVNYTHEDKLLTRDFDRLILSAGGKAYPNLGSRGDLFSQLTALGHIVLPMHPALSPVLADLGELRSLQGMRFDAAATLRDGDRVLAQTAGNLIVSGHIAGDLVGINPFVRALEERGVTVVRAAGL
ncbi:MAG TPA: NAD(P)/FAD-dependent oxidoreductase [Bellilinea sp.]|nr:NAD(P)/FAD-dependent oxidoreductase [Bellilinea sp.]